MPNIALLPGDGIGPEVAAAAVEVLNAVAIDLSYDEHQVGGAGIDAYGVAMTDETMDACKAVRRGPARRRRRPEVGHQRDRRRARRGRAVPPARRPRPVREPAPGQAAEGALRRLAAQARADRGRGHADRPRAHRRPLLRRARHQGRPRVRHDGLHGRRRSSGSSRVGVRGREVARDERRQGQRARHVAGCGARSPPASTPRSSRTSSSSTCWSTRPRCAWWPRRGTSR